MIKPSVLTLAYLFTIGVIAQNETPFFHISPKTESGYRTIKNTVEDSLGYIWMSQNKGILKYDGYDFATYPIDSIFRQSNIDDEVEKIGLDPNTNNVLVLSKNGLLSYLEKNGCFSLLNHTLLESGASLPINKFFVKKNSLWLIDFSNTIYFFNNETLKIDPVVSIPKMGPLEGEIVDLEVLDEENLYISTNNGKLYKYTNEELAQIDGPFTNRPGIMYLTLDKNEDLWIGTEYMGLFQYKVSKDQFKKLSYHRNKVDILKNDMILSLFCDYHGNIWAGSDGEGLYRINPNNDSIELFRHNPLNQFSLRTNSIINIYQDSNKNLWIVSNYGDINILVNSVNKIFHYNGLKGNVSARVYSLLKDSANNLWVGTDGKGVTKKNLTSGEEHQFLIDNESYEGYYIQTITEDRNGNIWIGTYKNGLWFYNSRSNEFSKIVISNPAGKEATDILTTFLDSKGRIWVGSDISLQLFNSHKEKIAAFEFGKNGLRGELIRSIVEDSQKRIWVGADGGGLFRYSEADNSEKLNESFFENLPYTQKTGYSSIVSMVSDGEDGLWLVDLDGNVHYFNTIDKSYRNFDNFKSLNDVAFHSVLMENSRNIWLGSNNGIWNFNLMDSSLVKFTKIDGFYNDYYIQRSAFKDKSGTLFFGGINGIDGFNPKNISKTNNTSKLRIDAIEILNKPATTLIPEQIKNGLDNTDVITLENNQSSFSFKFSVFGNILNPNYFYAYRLKGFNDEWNISGSNRIATYTNIPWGDYIFEVKASTSKGNWDIPSKSIEISIKPPLWSHPLAYLLYSIILFLLGYGIYRWFLLRKNLLLQKIKNEEETKSYYEKMVFFSKISHEIQTPLSLIIGPVEDILKKSNNRETDFILNQRLKIIFNNAKRLSRITKQLTTIRNKEIGRLKLKVANIDIIKELKEISESFKEQARFKKIDFEIHNFTDRFMLWVDIELLEHMVYNLLSNAFKYTPQEGSIAIKTQLDHENNMFLISIEDTGYGISKKEYEDIFKLFYRSKKVNHNKGMGIGLAFVKELINLHKGEIHVHSVLNKGTCFTISLPLEKNKYTKDEIIDYKQVEQSPDNLPLKFNKAKNKANRDSILIVEDNFEMLQFLSEVFNDNYNVYGAYNGKEGLQIVRDNLPDMIISDISMPIMDGLEMCKIIQKDRDVSHIPIIFLTAKNTTRHKLKGLKYGAIEFMQKPFDIKVLQLKVHNILAQNKKVFSKASLQYLSAPSNEPNKSKDVEFLEKLISILNSKLDNPDFKLEELATCMNMSYSSIYRKCQTLTGKTIVDLLKLIRLKKAATLIVKSKYNISEACFTVGFNDTRYFSKCFKEQFKMTPTAFKKEALKHKDLETFLSKHQLHF